MFSWALVHKCLTIFWIWICTARRSQISLSLQLELINTPSHCSACCFGVSETFGHLFSHILLLLMKPIIYERVLGGTVNALRRIHMRTEPSEWVLSCFVFLYVFRELVDACQNATNGAVPLKIVVAVESLRSLWNFLRSTVV